MEAFFLNKNRRPNCAYTYQINWSFRSIPGQAWSQGGIKIVPVCKVCRQKATWKKNRKKNKATKQSILRLLENENIPICFAACNMVFKSPFTAWCSFLFKLSSTNFIIFFQVRPDFSSCSWSFDLLVWKCKIFWFFKLEYGGSFKNKHQIKKKTKLFPVAFSQYVVTIANSFSITCSLHFPVHKEDMHILSSLYSFRGRIFYKAKLL